jgi:multisubunit Na+/H+ antiporter MnhB subunit
MEWWRWAAAAGATVLVLLILALRFDTLKDRRGGTAALAARRLSPWLLLIPVAVLAAVLGPWWLAAAVVAVPAVTLLAMAAVD